MVVLSCGRVVLGLSWASRAATLSPDDQGVVGFILDLGVVSGWVIMAVITVDLKYFEF